MFQIRNFNDKPFINTFVGTRVLEGMDVIEALAPISKVTHLRENPLTMLEAYSTDPVRSRLLGSLLQQIPSIVSDPALSDDDKFDMIRNRLVTGTPAEDQRYIGKLSAVVDDFVQFLLDAKEREEAAKIEAAKSAAVAAAAAAAAPAADGSVDTSQPAVEASV